MAASAVICLASSMEGDDAARERAVSGRRESRLASITPARSSLPGKRRTLAGRYVYAAPPVSGLPSTGTTRSNHTR